MVNHLGFHLGFHLILLVPFRVPFWVPIFDHSPLAHAQEKARLEALEAVEKVAALQEELSKAGGAGESRRGVNCRSCMAQV